MPFRALLAQRDFRWLWIGQICSNLGDRLTQMILIAVVGTRAPGSTVALATIMTWTVVPAFLVSPVAGAAVDRWDRRRTMVVSDLARSLGVLALPLLTRWPAMAPLNTLVFLLFAIACFFLPARLALTPALVAPDALVAANSLMTTSGMIGATISMLVGGLLVERVGVPTSCVLAAVAYVASAGCVLAVRHRAPPSTGTGYTRVPGTGLSLLADIGEGFHHCFSHAPARFVLYVLFLLMVASGAIFVVATVMVQQALGSVTRDLGVFSVMIGLGLFLGTVGYGRFGSRWDKPRLILWCLVACGLCLGAFAWGVGLRHSWRAGMVTTLLVGAVVAPIGTAVNTMIHELVHDRLWGRVFSAMGIVMNAAMLVGLWTAGLVAVRITPVGTLAAVSGLLAVGGALGLALRGAHRRPPASTRGIMLS